MRHENELPGLSMHQALQGEMDRALRALPNNPPAALLLVGALRAHADYVKDEALSQIDDGEGWEEIRSKKWYAYMRAMVAFLECVGAKEKR